MNILVPHEQNRIDCARLPDSKAGAMEALAMHDETMRQEILALQASDVPIYELEYHIAKICDKHRSATWTVIQSLLTMHHGER